MSLVLQSSGGGSVTIAEPATASNYTATMPAATGTVMVSGNMPAFSAYQSSAQTLSSVTATKIQLQTKEFDTASAFDNTTNYRFTPQVAGYYQVNGNVQVNTTSTNMSANIYKNGTLFKQGAQPASAGASGVSALVYFNGSTDYIELYAILVTGQILSAGAAFTYFQASMVRAA